MEQPRERGRCGAVPDNSFLLFTRIGFAARGALYLLVAWLALRLGRSEDTGGAMEYVKSQAGGWLLAAMAIGFAAYGAWRLLDALLDLQGRGSDAKGLGKRSVGVGSGLVHLGLAFSAARLALGGGGGAHASERAEQGAATAMDLPGGEALLYVVAAGLAVAGIVQLRVALRRRFLRHLEPGARAQGWISLAGCCGYAARGIVFLTAAWLALRAGLDQKPNEAGALGDALASLPTSVQMLVAGGLALFGVYSLIEARYRILADPRVKRRVQEALR
ncbi:MAG TPA: DUF1206 domain-containing protein [Allosphingosinicella sp.]|nr:DUF1206 domain-containing protein [Allosphingosinicella sp.]